MTDTAPPRRRNEPSRHSAAASFAASTVLSAADYAKLVGVSELTIYNWEQGKSKPSAEGLAAWVAIRDLRKREALRRLEMVGG